MPSLIKGKILLPLASSQPSLPCHPPICRLSLIHSLAAPPFLKLPLPIALGSALSHHALPPALNSSRLSVSVGLPRPPRPRLCPPLPFPPIPVWWVGRWLKFGGGSPSSLYHFHNPLEGQRHVFLLITAPRYPLPPPSQLGPRTDAGLASCCHGNFPRLL